MYKQHKHKTLLASCLLYIAHVVAMAEEGLHEVSGQRFAYQGQTLSFVADVNSDPSSPQGWLYIARACLGTASCTSSFMLRANDVFAFQGKTYRVDRIAIDQEMRQRIAENATQAVPLVGLSVNDAISFRPLAGDVAVSKTDSFLLIPGKALLDMHLQNKTMLRMSAVAISGDASAAPQVTLIWQTSAPELRNELLNTSRHDGLPITEKKLSINDMVELKGIGKLKVQTIIAPSHDWPNGAVVLVAL